MFKTLVLITKQHKINSYLVNVILRNRLKTNYEKVLHFLAEAKETAEIITD